MDARSLRSGHDTSGGRTARIVMWSGIAGSVVLLLVLLARGWGSSALTTAAGVLLVLCGLTCIWAGIAGKRSARDVERAIDRLVTARREAESSSAKNEEGVS